MLTLFLATVLASPTADAQAKDAAPDTGRVVQVYDGDTLTLESGDRIRHHFRPCGWHRESKCIDVYPCKLSDTANGHRPRYTR